MSKFSTSFLYHAKLAQPSASTGSSSAMQSQPAETVDSDRLTELEVENSRLHRLVAELLIKNQQLRAQGSTS